MKFEECMSAAEVPNAPKRSECMGTVEEGHFLKAEETGSTLKNECCACEIVPKSTVPKGCRINEKRNGLRVLFKPVERCDE